MIHRPWSNIRITFIFQNNGLKLHDLLGAKWFLLESLVFLVRGRSGGRGTNIVAPGGGDGPADGGRNGEYLIVIMRII